MKKLFAVTRIKGQAWDEREPMRSQVKWNEHAIFMDQLAEQGFVVLGGPLDDGKILLIIDSENEDKIRSVLSRDPWSKLKILDVEKITPWTIFLESGVNN